MGLKEMAERWGKTKDLVELIFLTLRTVNVRELQLKHGYTKGRKVRFDILDTGRHLVFALREGKVEIVTLFTGNPDVQVVFDKLCTLKHLRLGYRAGIHPGTGKRVAVSYAPLDAWKMSDVRSYGDSSTNDILSVVTLFLDLMVKVPAEKVASIIGPCEHDVTLAPAPAQKGAGAGGGPPASGGFFVTVHRPEESAPPLTPPGKLNVQ